MHMTGLTRTARVSHNQILITGPAGGDVALHHADGTPVEVRDALLEVTRLFTGFHPTYLLDVTLANRTAMTCFVDQDGVKLGEEPEKLPDEILAGLQHSLLGPDRPSASFYRPDGDVGLLDEQFLKDIIFVSAIPDVAGLRLSCGDTELYALRDTRGRPIPAFAPGWRARFLFTGFAPLHVLELVHQDGRKACWYLSSNGVFLSHLIDIVPESFKRRIAVFGARLFLQASDPQQMLLRGFGLLNWRTRLDLEPFFPVPVPLVREAAAAGHFPVAMNQNSQGHSMSFERRLMPPCSEALVPVEQINPEATGFDRDRLGAGWSFRDHRCWATSQDNVVLFTVPSAAGRRRVARLRVDFQPSHIRRLVTVTVNGWAIGEFVIDPDHGEDSRRDFWIPARVMQTRQLRCVLSFDKSGEHYACIVRGIRLDLSGPSEPAEPDPRMLMMEFETIGDNCEFELVQRYFGAEPAGLLRVADYGDLSNLIRLIENRFEGSDRAGTLSAQVISSIARLELGTRTSESQSCHSNLEALKEAEHKRSCLRRKMIERLEQASRIWLVKRTDHTHPHEIFSLHAALKAYGPNRLFWVRSVKPGRPAGSVEWIADDLLCGYSDQDPVQPHVFDPAGWLALCENAHRAFAGKVP